MPKPSKDDLPYRTPLDDFVRGVRKAAALKAGLELEIFTRIFEGHHTLPALLRVSGLNERGARLLLDSLVNIGLLSKSTFEYSLSPSAETFLVKGKPTYYGDALLAQLAWDIRGQVARAVKIGKPAGGTAAEEGTRLLVTHEAASWATWESVVQEFAEAWDELGPSVLPNGARAAGLGVEAGIRLFSLAERDKKSHLMVVDDAPALSLIRPIVESLASKPRIELLEGDWKSAPLAPGSQDLVMIDSLTAYGNLEDNLGVLHSALEALAMGGRVLVRAWMSDDDRKGPGWVPLAGLDLLLASPQGDIYTVTEYRGMLEAAGFFEVKQVGDHAGLLTARRLPPPPPPPPAATPAPDFIPPPETLA